MGHQGREDVGGERTFGDIGGRTLMIRCDESGNSGVCLVSEAGRLGAK